MQKTIVIGLILALLAPNANAAGSSLFQRLAEYQQPNIHIGQLALHPYYTLSETYDSNIYLVPRDKPNGVVVGGGHRESWITKNNLGLEANLPWHRLHELDLGYDFESQKYTTQPETNDTINQAAHADYKYAGAYGVTFKAGDKYVNTTDTAFSELIARQRRWNNRAYVSLDYSPENNRLAAGVDASQKNDKYINPTFAALLNRYEQRAGGYIGYKIYPKTTTYVSYHRDVIHYSVPTPAGGINKNNRSHEVGVGVFGQLAPKVEGQVEAGFTHRQYDVSAVNGGSRIRNSPTVSTSVTWKPSVATSATLALSRYIQESTDPTNPSYVANDVAVSARHSFPRKWTVGVKGEITIDKYYNAPGVGGPSGTRRDDLYQGGAWVDYEIQKWLSTSVAYLYRERFSTFSGQFNYDDHLLSWTGSLKF